MFCLFTDTISLEDKCADENDVQDENTNDVDLLKRKLAAVFPDTPANSPNESEKDDVFGNVEEACNVQVIKTERNEKDFEQANIHETFAQATTIDNIHCENKRKLVSTEEIKNDTSIVSAANIASGSSEDISSVISVLSRGVNSLMLDSESKCHSISSSLGLPESSVRHSYINNNSNVSTLFFPEPASISSWKLQTPSAYDLSLNISVPNDTYKTNNAKSNFNFGMNDVCSMNSIQVQAHNLNICKNTKSSTNISACERKLNKVKDKDCFFRSVKHSQISILKSDIMDSLSTSGCNKNVSSSSIPLVEMSMDSSVKSATNYEIPKALDFQNSDNANPETIITEPSNLSLKTSTWSFTAQNDMYSLPENTSLTVSFGLYTSFPIASRNISPTSIENYFRNGSDAIKTVSIESDKPDISLGASDFNNICPAICQESSDTVKSVSHTTPTSLKSSLIKPSKSEDIGKLLGDFFFASSSDKTPTTTCSGLTSSSFSLSTCSPTSFTTANTNSLFGTPIKLPKTASSQVPFQPKCFSSKEFEPSADKISHFTFGCIPKQNSTGQSFNYATPLKTNQVDAAQSPLISNIFSVKTTPTSTSNELFKFDTPSTSSSNCFKFGTPTISSSSPFKFGTPGNASNELFKFGTPSTKRFHFGTSSPEVNFNFGSSSGTPANSVFNFNQTYRNDAGLWRLHDEKGRNIHKSCKYVYLFV